jgi:ribosomal protein S12 methylthiotransferase accessory factor
MVFQHNLYAAFSAAKLCGVTRLANVSRLDHLGVHVFQAIRPMGRALSVHQGKGLSPSEAKIGALMEAVESDHAEAFVGDQRLCALDDLETSERPITLGDYASHRPSALASTEPIIWVRAERLRDGSTCWAPFDVVSLDFTRRGDQSLERSSNGLGAGFDRESAIVTAMLEVIERDAVQVWRAAPGFRRTRDRVASDSIPYAWFRDLSQRIRNAGLRITVYRVHAVVGLPVIVCELGGPLTGAANMRRHFGSSCRSNIETALERSIAEAAQSRLTTISGVRDDISTGPDDDGPAGGSGLGLPLPTHMRQLTWSEVEAGYGQALSPNPDLLAGLLADMGYRDSALVDLSRPGAGVYVVKALVPGLANGGRCRRKPEHAK